MACELEPLLIGKDDFNCIGQVATHCDWNQLCIYIREQQNLALLPKIGQCLWNMLMCYKMYEDCVQAGGEDCQPCDYVADTETLLIFENIICGGSYTGCDGTKKIHFGLRRMLVHYAYGAYIYRHGYVDTPFGVVQKANNDSLPAPMQELRNLMKEHQNNAEYYWQMTKDYLCTIKDIEPFSECLDCYKCDCCCDHCKGQGKTKQNRGVTFGNVEKFDDKELRRINKWHKLHSI